MILFLKKIVLIFFGIGLSFLAFEFFMPTSKIKYAPQLRTVHPLNNWAIAALKESPYKNWKHNIEQPTDYDFTKRYKVFNPSIKFFQPSTSIQATLFYAGFQNSIYNVNYSFNSVGFRNVPASKINAKLRILFMGCSFTFGEGLNDRDTFSNHFAKMNPKIEVLNFGTPGDGPNHFLYSLQNPSARVLSQKKSIDIIIYTALDDIMERATCSFDYCIKYASFSEKYLLSPMYKINNNGQVEYKGDFSENFPWNQKWLFYLAHSRAVKALDLLNFTNVEDDMITTARVLRELKALATERWNTKRFIVAFYPKTWNITEPARFKKILEENGIEVLDFSQINAASKDYDLFYKMDDHPTPAGAFLYASLLNRMLNLKH